MVILLKNNSNDIEITINKDNLPYGTLLILDQLNSRNNVRIKYGNETSFLANEINLKDDVIIARHLARVFPYLKLYEGNPLQLTEIDNWTVKAVYKYPNLPKAKLYRVIDKINTTLTRSNSIKIKFLVGDNLTLADIFVWAYTQVNPEFSNAVTNMRKCENFISWFSQLSSICPFNKIQINEEALTKIKEQGNIIKKRANLVESAKVTNTTFGGLIGKESLNNQNTSPYHPKDVIKKTMSKEKKRDEGKFIELPNAIMGKVVTRFPPEASGYLHIGHAKAALLNQYYQQTFDGKLIMRFDDTNPAKETEEFEEEILKDVELLHIKPDKFSHTSDHFETLLKFSELLLKSGYFYVDDTDPDTLKKEREARKCSKNRDNSIEKNLKMWEEMKKGTIYGQTCCVRAKIEMDSNNGCMRDPTMYRCKNENHIRTCDRYKVYPTYDFACPIVDSIEGVTHALRTTEYHDRDDQYYWIYDTIVTVCNSAPDPLINPHSLQLPNRPNIMEYSRLNMMHTVLSKRKLNWLLNELGVVQGWDDPRFPTLRGILRRGLTIEGLKNFILAQGSSKSVVNMDWDKIWSFNKKVIEPSAHRYVALDRENIIKVVIQGLQESVRDIPLHPKDVSFGSKKTLFSPNMLIEQADGVLMKEGDIVTFMNLGNVRVNKINYADHNKSLIFMITGTYLPNDKDYKNTIKINWLATKSVDQKNLTLGDNLIPIDSISFDYLITKPVLAKEEDFKDYINTKDTWIEKRYIGEIALGNIKKGQIIQLLRKGFYICDSQYESFDRNICRPSIPLRLFSIPDGSSTTTTINTNSTCNVKDKVIKTIVNPYTKEKPQEIIDENVKTLLSLKSEFKLVTQQDWKPDSIEKSLENCNATKPNPKTAIDNEEKINSLNTQIKQQGDKIRQIKSTITAKLDKASLDSEIKILLSLKSQYKILSGKDWIDANIKEKSEKSKSNRKEKDKLIPTEKEKNKDNAPVQPNPTLINNPNIKKVTRLGLEVRKSENFSEWYTQVITKAEMIEYYDVSGCYILRPWSYNIWESIQKFFDTSIKALGVSNVYFPIFVSRQALETEKNHINDFSPEVAWVTKSGDTDLAEPIAIRPTSETVMYPAYAKWIKSYRDLPLKLNQWNNIVRWEFKHPTPFIRTREFLWQEGHSAFATYKEAEDEVYTILDLYARVYEELMAIPVIKGRKTEKEKFAGGVYTTTVEAYIDSTGRGIQGATSHHLGQNFSRIFDITYENPDWVSSTANQTEVHDVNIEKQLYVYQNSWGLTTRTIGVMVMIHGDDLGLVLPPRIAPIQVVIIPCGLTAILPEQDKQNLLKMCEDICQRLKSVDIRCKADTRDHYSPGWKFNHWELKGVPLRIEIGPKELVNKTLVLVRRDTVGDRQTLANEDGDKIVTLVQEKLTQIHDNLFEKAKDKLDNNRVMIYKWSEFCQHLDQKHIIEAPFCGDMECEDEIKKLSASEDTSEATGSTMGAKSLCIPFKQCEQIKDSHKCIRAACSNKPKFFTLFGRSY
ncbi:bifunctional glutamate/proline--tRNA ligase-like isoform X2 [Gordionus sp. m RMFG-2023]|uniref:bifunctional glutamate/proline--tRNA ligase-like isoform X2 n=1 Tax=Gordionus sp. m RMFG-2023 TaxID=3053472 RepID=UPI0031FDCF3E